MKSKKGKRSTGKTTGRERWIARIQSMTKCFRRDLDRESDRGLVVGLVAYVDALTLAIVRKTFVVPMSKTHRLLDGPVAPIGNLAARIDLLNLMGLISDRMANDLHSLRTIRNSFAHETQVRSLGDPPVQRQMRKMHRFLPGEFPGADDPAHRRFYLVSVALIEELHRVRNRVKKGRPAALEHAYRLLDYIAQHSGQVRFAWFWSEEAEHGGSRSPSTTSRA
jgi:hypothetical protein